MTSASVASSAYAPTAARALSYFTERAEDAQAAIMGILGGSGPGVAGPSGAERYLAEVDLGSGEAENKLIRSKLESNSEYERLEGLRTVVAMISRSLPAADHLFPSVLKLTSVQSLQVKTLVYLVTLRLAPAHPDVALLSINSFQRDLSDPSPLIRGMALRVLSGLGVKMAAAIMEMAIAKSARDTSAYTRRIAADAIGKCYELSRSRLPALIPHLSTLLADRHPSVLGSAVLALSCTAPDRDDLLHSNYRRICYALVDVDEWNQPVTLRVLLRYARRNLSRPSRSECERGVGFRSPAAAKWGAQLDCDLELLLNKARPLLTSRNSATVLAAAHLYLSLLPLGSPFHAQLVDPLQRLLRSHPTQAHGALLFIRSLHKFRPDLFAQRLTAFIPQSPLSGEPVFVSSLKLNILVDIAISSRSVEAITSAMNELEETALHRPELSLRKQGVDCIGRLASMPDIAAIPSFYERCIQIVLQILENSATSNGERALAASTLGVIRTLIPTVEASATAPQHSAGAFLPGRVLQALAGLLFRGDGKSAPVQFGIKDAVGRARAFWLLGENCRLPIPVREKTGAAQGHVVFKTLAETILPELLRQAAVNFEKEQKEAKLAIVGLSSKLFTLLPTTDAEPMFLQTVSKLHCYVLQLARFDAVFDVRDRARYYKGLTSALEGNDGVFTSSSDVAGTGAIEDDCERDHVAGVRLRREQVLKVLFDGRGGLFEGQSTEAEASPDPAVALDAWTLSMSLKDGHGFSADVVQPLAIPPWEADPCKLPPASVRDAILMVAPASEADATIGDVTLPVRVGAGVRSLSSLDFVKAQGSRSEPLIPLASSTPDSGSRTTATVVGAPQGKGKYKDLDAFLAEDGDDSGNEDSETETSSEGEKYGDKADEGSDSNGSGVESDADGDTGEYALRNEVGRNWLARSAMSSN